jgi:predicted component of viral defense system (DUF524 family)
MMRFASGLGLTARRGDAEAVEEAGRVRLDGRYSWVVTGPEHLLLEVEESLPGIAERIGSALLLDFGNSVGRFEAPHLGTLDVVSSKWTEADFGRMLADLSRIAAQLPFSAGKGGSLPYDRTLVEPRPILYHLFAYLRYVLSDDRAGDDALAPALAAVVRDPHRRIVGHSRMVPTDRARGVSPSELMALVAGRRPLVPVAARMGGGATAARLGGCLPEEVRENIVRNAVDTPENRFVKTFLETLDAILHRVEEAFDGSGALCRRILSDSEHLRRRLEPFRRAGLWQEVGRLTHFPAASTVLQRRRGYRTVFRCHALMRLGSRLPLDEESSRRLLEIRDIAELYELWCYFRCVELVSDCLGSPTHADSLRPGVKSLDVPWDYRVRWSDGTSIYYNLRFPASGGGLRRSYSLPLRPDIVLEVPTGPASGFHIFDAKFRLRSIGTGLDEKVAVDEEDVPEGRRTFKNDDLYKMHTYRDAIPGTRSARVLYPGSEDRFFAVGDSPWDGVGAYSLVPGENGARSAVVDLLASGRRIAS